MPFSNTDTGSKPADLYKATNIDELSLKEKVEDLTDFISGCKFGIMTTRDASSGALISRCMALAGKVTSPFIIPFTSHNKETQSNISQENGGIDLLFHTNTESGKTDDISSDPHINMPFLNSSGE
ncbi:hypothetical protein G7Y89_g14625 [Cudoniella acicularis]|uniref:Uncharacterized protein n=1 Tax=Cudoniella acicularis TaxID=354080 RepID=A0A8H4R1P3_9HELO|nr:hypothetical protein G7Y89_g14625 [Cudoniella acicularis]